jgi:phosphotransferase system  glucose/maltose/N-acetylglucosamine-specific IIC component
VAEAAALPERTPLATPAKTFNVGDIFRDRATFGKFAAIIGLTMGQIFPAAFFGVLAQHLGWYSYFLLSGFFVTGCCFVFYWLFDRIEAAVDARDRAELAHDHSSTTAGVRHGIG